MKLGVVGVTGVVGAMILRVLEERRVPVGQLRAYASRDREETVRFADRDVAIHAATAERLRNDRNDVVIFASSDDASTDLAPVVIEAGGIVIDNSATFRMDPDCPLVVPEVNAEAIRPEHRIFPVGNCTAIVLCVALAPVVRAVGLRSVRVATYQAVSGAGRAGIETLENEERGGRPNGTFAAAIHRNVIPQIGAFDAFGDTGEEKKVAAETRRILGLPTLHVAATTVRVPVMRAHSAAVFFDTETPTTRETLARALETAAGTVYHPEGIVTSRDVEDTDAVHIARLRPEADNLAEEGSSITRFQMWVVGDQLRKGAATNGVQILEELIQRGMLMSSVTR